MSPDDVFAAQFWPWPDPAIKRDMEGRVLFVNAAFLSLYGGRVEDWRGNAVGGWPAPQAPVEGQVMPYRFETRLPDDMGGEQIYDWIEQPLADGNAFALARNVTIFTQSPDPEPVMAEPAPAPEMTQTPPPPAVETPVREEPALAPAMAAPAVEPPPMAPAVAETAPPPPPPPAEDVPDIPIPEIDIPSDDDYALTQSVSEAPAVPETPVEAEPQAPAFEEPREFERRALPIESESAVLGNNWRDAVIAKAVGAEDEPAAKDDTAVQAPAAPPTEPTAPGGPIRILLAEDNAINALLTRTLLEAEGHTVETVEDGALAVDAMKTGQYDLIFMDMRMPNMDGLEATRKIRTLPHVSKDLPIIALTANAFDDDRNACFDSGMNDFMTKPVSAEELSEMVAEWTGAKSEERLAS